MHPRSRIRGREPPPPQPGGGRYRRRSPPPPSPSPRHHHQQRRPRDSPQRRIPERPPAPHPQRRSSPERPPPPPPLQRRSSPERLPPRRLLLDDKPPPPPPLAVPTGERRWREDILLEAGRLAAHYLVAQGVLPEHVLHAREDPSPKPPNTNHNPSPRSLPEVPAPAPGPAGGYARKRDDEPHPDDDPRWPRRNGVGGGKGDWGRDARDKREEEDERLARARTGWDRRSQSFDDRRNRYNNDSGGGGGAAGGAGDWGRDKNDGDRLADRGGGGRRSNVYDDKRWPAMSRSYSQNDRRASSNDRRPYVDDCRPSADDRRPLGDDRRPSVDRRLDRRRRSRSRSRSRSRTRPRNSYGGVRQRDSDWRARNGDMDQSNVTEYRTVGGSDVDRDDVDHVPREPKGPRSMVVMKADDGASHEYEEVVVMEADDDGASHEDEEGMVSDDHGEDDGASYEYEEVVESEEDEEMVESVDRGQDVRRDEDGEAAAVAGLNDADGAGEINASHQLSIVDVHPSEPAEEPLHMHSQLSDVEEDTEAGSACRDACLIEPVAENSGCSEARGEMQAPQIELETELVEKAPQIELETELVEKAPQIELETELVEKAPQIELETELLEEIPQNELVEKAPRIELETELRQEIPQNELETDAGDPNRDEEELPAWFGIFDLNVTGAQESCEIPEIPGDPPADHVLDSLPDLVGQTSQQGYYDTVETQGQEELADDNQQSEEGCQVLLNQGIGTYDSSKNDLNNEQMLIDQSANEHEPGDEQLEDEQMLVNNEEILKKQDAEEHVYHNHQIEEEHVDHNHQIENEQMLVNNEDTLLKQDAEEHVDHNHQMENEQMLLNEGTDVQVLDNCQVNGEQLLPDHAIDEHCDVDRQAKNEQMLLDNVTVTGVHDLDHGNLNGEQMLQNIGADKPAADAGLLKDGHLHLDQAADGQATFQSLGNGQTTPVINLEDDDEEQSDTEEFLDPNFFIGYTKFWKYVDWKGRCQCTGNSQ